MPNRHDGAPAMGTAASSGREIKFIFTAKRAGRIIQWLDNVSRPDSEHPTSIISSIYFDTHGLHCVDEKLNSDYLKSKYRLRWYGKAGQAPESGDPVFAEAKFRTGGIRRKLRAPAPFDAPALADNALEDPKLLEFNRVLRDLGAIPNQTLLPSLEVQYERRRYIDAVSGARICVDTEVMTLLKDFLGNARLEGVNQADGQAVVSYSFLGLQDESVPRLHEALSSRLVLKDFNIYFHRPGAL